MFLNIFLFFFLLIFSIIIFFIDNLSFIIIIFVISLLLTFLFKIKLPLYLPFIILLIINFTLNLLFSNIIDASIVTIRLVVMFILANLIIKKIGIYNLSNVIGIITRSKSITLIIAISFSFIPIMIKEISEIKRSLITKNFTFNFKNIITKPHIFVNTFFNNIFKKVNDMEKVLISKGIEEENI